MDVLKSLYPFRMCFKQLFDPWGKSIFPKSPLQKAYVFEAALTQIIFLFKTALAEIDIPNLRLHKCMLFQFSPYKNKYYWKAPLQQYVLFEGDPPPNPAQKAFDNTNKGDRTFRIPGTVGNTHGFRGWDSLGRRISSFYRSCYPRWGPKGMAHLLIM